MSDALSAPGLAEQWLQQVLGADSQLAALVGPRIYTRRVPQGGTYPAVVYAQLAGVDTTALGMIRALTRTRYAVKAVDQTASIVTLDAIARRVDQLLQGGVAQLANGLQLGCIRLSILALDGAEQGIEYRQIVQTYEIVVKETS